MSKFINKVVTVASSIALAASMLVVPFASTAHAATAGEVYKSTDGTVWFITSDMHRRPFTSWGAFQSYGFLSASQIKDADSSVTALSTGDFIAPQDGRIFCATMTKGSDVAGECSLITGMKKAAFTSAAVFTGQGYSFSRAFYGDSSFLDKTSNIDNASAQHRPGTLINNNGTVQLVVSGGLWGVPSMDVFNSWGWSFADVVPANSADVLLSQTGVIPARMAGQLVPTATTGGGGTGTADCDNLDGNAGDITVTQDSSLSNEQVGEGEEEVGVLGFKVEADDSSDVSVTSVKIELKQTDTDVSQNLDDYVDQVQIWHGDDMVGSADASDFNENSDIYTKSISLDCAAITAGEKDDFSVSLTAVNSIDSADLLDENWEVELQQVRFEDGDGVTTTESIASNSIDETIDFVNFSTAADVELNTTLTDGEEDTNEAHNVIVDDNNDTTNEPILSFTLKAQGDSDVTVKGITVNITGSDSDLDTVVSTADLYHGSTKIDSDSVSTAGVSDDVIFDDFNDITIDAGDSEDFTVKVKINELTGNYAQGATISASVTVASIDAEDEEGDDLTGTELSGSAVGENLSLFSQGIAITVDSAETNVTTNDGATNDTVEFVWDLTVENIGDTDVYVNSDAADIVDTSGATNVDQVYEIQRSGGAALTGVSATIVDTSTATDIVGDDTSYGGVYNGENFYRISSGATESFRITLSGANQTNSKQVRAYLEAFEWTTNDVACPSACNGSTAAINSYTAQLPTDSETPYKFIN